MSLDFTAFARQRSAVPVWRQVYAFISGAVARGDLQPGDGLPGEQSMADAMDVSIDTVRQALAVLREDGVIVTTKGIGSFIA